VWPVGDSEYSQAVDTQRTVWLRLECAFIFVGAIVLCLLPLCSDESTCARNGRPSAAVDD
jgi:hypothetical protein